MPRDYKSTVLLPETDFAMKADLAKREPAWLARWDAADLYGQILAAPTDKRFVFHDGPPYANGHMHYGHVLNNALKDFVTRFRNLVGERTRFVPGWDCHGLPIELNVDKALGSKKRDMSTSEVRAACEREATKWFEIQREERKRVGVLGTWSDPYLTMSPKYEAAVVRALAAFVERGLVYRGKKPVQWCSNDRTALAESEVEYIENHQSPSVYVKFAATDAATAALRTKFPAMRAAKCFVVVWTTTPWTLPANLAIAIHPELTYTLLEVDGADGTREAWLVASSLANAVAAATGAANPVVLDAHVAGRDLVGLVFRHPWEDRDSRLVEAAYVEADAGTGLVHTAPGHGRDDYVTGIKNGLEAYAPLDDAGRFTDELGDGSKSIGIVGKSVWDANPLIVAFMHERGVLANAPGQKITHKYPGCWRCHRPLITRATTQWFIALDEPMKGAGNGAGRSLRAVALAEIDRLADDGAKAEASSTNAGKSTGTEGSRDSRGWIPSWGRERIHGMIAGRPDWCISRQRVWGVPIPALHCEKCNHATLSSALLAHVAGVFSQHGAGAWSNDALDVIPPGFTCESCGAAGPFARDKSIVDVWFESGASFYAVCEGAPDHHVPVDLYLEGSDQHRGWFHSALLVGVALTGRAPFRAVVTHGFVVDERGEAMSKSVVNARRERGEDVSHLDPLNMIKQQGAELLRAWSAYEDYRGDVRLSKEHFTQVAEMYRKVRNAFRFMLSVMRKRPPPRVQDVALLPIDRWVLGRLHAVVTASEHAYRTYEFRSVLVGAVEFLGDLSSSYLDVIKDWLYNDAENSPRRLSTLATVDAVVRSMAVVLAPILPFTAEDVWDHMAKRAGDPASVHLAKWPTVAPQPGVASLDAAGDGVRALRELVHAALEPKVQAWGAERQAAKRENREPGEGSVAFVPASRIDHGREALATVTLSTVDVAKLEPLRDVLSESLVLGEIDLRAGDVSAVEIVRNPGERCDRCWRRRRDVGSAGLCVRCADAVSAFDKLG